MAHGLKTLVRKLIKEMNQIMIKNEDAAESLVMQLLKDEGYKTSEISIDGIDDYDPNVPDALEYSAWSVDVKNGNWNNISVWVVDGIASIQDGGYDDSGEAEYFNRWNQGDNIGYDEPQGYYDNDYDDYY